MSPKPSSNKILRDLIKTAFSEVEFELFCDDYFPDAKALMGAAMPRLLKIQVLIEYCRSRGFIDDLLMYIQGERPNVYSERIGSIRELMVASREAIAKNGNENPSDRNIIQSKELISITLPGVDLSNQTDSERESISRAMASLLAETYNINPSSVKVAFLKLGSLILGLLVPVSMVEDIMNRNAYNTSTMREMGISRVIRHGKSLGGLDLHGIDLEYTEMTDANMRSSDLSGASFRGSILSRSNLSDANLRGSDLTNAVLNEVDLRKANLSGAILTSAVLTKADLRNANLQGARLDGAILRDAILEGANLEGAVFKIAQASSREVFPASTETQGGSNKRKGDVSTAVDSAWDIDLD